MKKVLLLVSLITLVSCNEPNVTKTSTGIIINTNGSDVEEITIDGCQYIGYFHGSNCDWGTHKGTCNNPIHQKSKVTVVDTVEYKLIRE
jgi:hypothetical protein